MKFLAAIDIMPHKELLDPQGKTVTKNLSSIDINDVQSVRIGKHIEVQLEAKSKDEAEKTIEKACKKMFANVIMESYRYTIEELN